MITEKKQSTPLHANAHIVTLDDRDVVPLASAYHAGEVIGDKYRLLSLLGEGGMGVVWLARNVALDSDVAIKLLRAGEKSDRLERRMLKEARAVARLGHPAILRVFDFGTTHRRDPYMVMELLDGEDLAKTLERKGRLSAVKAVRTLLPILHALGTAHQKGIVHRDLKPENIFLTTTDSGYVQPKLVDFGIVKTEVPELDRLTRMGTVLGTPAYLSPEQARGEDVDQRADVWSAAVVLYEMVTCRLPFDGSNYNSLMRSIIEDLPPPITSFGSGDAELWAILERGLAKHAAARWPSMSAFGGALANWLLSRGESDDISGASLRAAWQQGPTAARPADLYSGPPSDAERSPAHGETQRAAPADTIADSKRGTRAPSARRAPPRRIGLLAGAGAVLLIGTVFVAARRPASPQAHVVAAPPVLSVKPEPASGRSPWITSGAGDERPLPAPLEEAPPEAEVAAAPVPKQDVPEAVSSPEAPIPRNAAATRRAHTAARMPIAGPPDDLKTSL